MMHHGLDHYRVFEHQHGTDQIVGTFGDVLESPQVDSILVACFAGIDYRQQFGLADIAFVHAQAGMTGQDDRAVKAV